MSKIKKTCWEDSVFQLVTKRQQYDHSRLSDLEGAKISTVNPGLRHPLSQTAVGHPQAAACTPWRKRNQACRIEIL